MLRESMLTAVSKTRCYCCDRKVRAARAQGFTLWLQATLEMMHCNHSIIACSRHIYNGVILHAHPVRGESHNQRNTTGEVATTSPPFYNEPQRSHVLWEGCTWHDLHILITPPFCCDQKARAARAQSFTLWQQRTIEITLLLRVRATYIWVLFFAHTLFVVNRTFNATLTERLQHYH